MRHPGWPGFLALVVLAGCAEVDRREFLVFDPGRDSGRADFSVLVAVGSSLTAGVQDAGLRESGQRTGYAALIARQVGKMVLTDSTTIPRSPEFVLPGVADPGSPGTLVLTSLVPPEIEPVQNPGDPINTQYPGQYNNLAVPGANAADVPVTVTSPSNPSFDLVLRGLGTMLQQAEALNPSFVIVWLGENEVLDKVTGNVPLPTAAEFESDYRTVIDALVALPSTPDLITANIPDVTAIPYVTTIPPVVADPATREPVLVDGNPVPLIGPGGPLSPGDRVTLAAQDELEAGTGIPAPFGTGAPLSEAVVLDVAEQAAVKAAVAAINQVIAEVAGENGIPVADVHGLLSDVIDGIEVGGIAYTSEFILGGVFSLDGIHPTPLGYALVANLFIPAINQEYGSSIPRVDLSEFADAP